MGKGVSEMASFDRKIYFSKGIKLAMIFISYVAQFKCHNINGITLSIIDY